MTPIIVAGALSTASGLGQSARLCHEALRLAGVKVLGIDLSADLMQPQDISGFTFDDGRARLGTGTLILHVNAPFVPLALWRLGARFLCDKRIVGYWAWELPKLPADWRHGMPFVHDILVPSRFVADAVRPLSGGRPVHVLPHAVMAERPHAGRPPRPPGQPFTVLTIFNAASSIARKNPAASIDAFRLAFGGDPTARLIVKVANLNSCKDAESVIKQAVGTAETISVIDGVMSEPEIDVLYQRADCVLSLHRSEGFGLVLAEAMARGIPVVATDWSGNVDFLTHATGCPVPFRLVPAADPQHTYNHPGMLWAEPDVAMAAQCLRQLRDEPDKAARLGENAARFAVYHWNALSYVDTLKTVLGLSKATLE